MLRAIECEGGQYYVHHDAVVHDGSLIGPETKIWGGAEVFSGASIGRGCVIGAGVFVETNVKLGNYCKVQRGVTLYQGVEAEDYVFFGPNATTTNDRNPRSFGDWELTKTIVETGASIGANATLVAGNRIGALSLVGAGSVVVRNVMPGELVAGNPATTKGWVDVSGNVIARHVDELPHSFQENMNNPKLVIETFLRSLNEGNNE